MNKLKFIIAVISFPFVLFSQNELKNWELNGYVSDMSSYLKSDLLDIEYLDHTIHNRLNFFWYTNNKITTSIQVRNRLIIGDQLRADTLDIVKDELKDDFMSFNLVEDKIMVLIEMRDSNFSRLTGQTRLNPGPYKHPDKT